MKTSIPIHSLAALMAAITFTSLALVHAEEGKSNAKIVADEHAGIGLLDVKDPAAVRTTHPDAQWYPDAGLGLFLHWSISSVKSMNISWPMIPGKNLRSKHIDDPAERDRMIREKDFDLNGKPWDITPNEYWAMAADFNPANYDPDKWCAAAKVAGFSYVVLTVRHHDGFAMWPSAFGDFSTKNFMGGRDLVKPYVEACRRHGLKVGLYYSPPNWHFERDFKDFFSYARQRTPEFPPLDADLKPHTETKTPVEIAVHQKAYDAMVRGQMEELLTNYGKIDLLWFDGCQPTPNGARSITAERIRELQPGIVINPRLHGTGDFITYERELKTNKIATTWAEFCNTWALLWTYDTRPFRSNAFVLGQLALCRSLGINYLLGIGPDAQGEFHPKAYENMAVVAEWMKNHAIAVHAVKPLSKDESADVPATALGDTRFLFAIPHFKGTNGKEGMFDAEMEEPGEVVLTLNGQSGKPTAVTLLGDGAALDHRFSNGTLTVTIPAARRTKLVDVVRIDRKPVEVTLHVDESKPGPAIPADFLGFSYEKNVLALDHFKRSNNAMVNLMRNLGNGVLRFGGNYVEITRWEPKATKSFSNEKSLISTREIIELYQFSRASGWNVIYGLNLGANDPEMAASEAAAALKAGGETLIAFEIGNEPELYAEKRRPAEYSYQDFSREVSNYLEVMRPKVARIPLCGPGTTSNFPWFTGFLHDFSDDLVITTRHNYPLAAATTDPANPRFATIENLLSPTTAAEWRKLIGQHQQASKAAGFPFRVTEAGSASSGGKPGVSDVFASALWCADYLFVLAELGVSGVNFHGSFNCRGYTSFCALKDGGYHAHANYYGMLFFRQAAQGSIIPLEQTGNGANLTSYAVLGDDGALRIAIINKDLEKHAKVGIKPANRPDQASLMRLSAPAVDAKADITLGGAGVASDGTWQPKPPESVTASDGNFHIDVPAASAALLVVAHAKSQD